MLFSRVYVMKFEVCQEYFMLLSRVLVIKFEVCQHCFVLSRVYVMKFGYVRSDLCYCPVFI